MRNIYIIVLMTLLSASFAKKEKRKALIISVDESKPEDTDVVISDLNLEEQSAVLVYRPQYSPRPLQPLPADKQPGYILLTPENIQRLKNVNGVVVDNPRYVTYPSGPSAESYDSHRNPSPEYGYKLKYPLSPSSETGDIHYSPKRNKYPERPAPPLTPLSLNRTFLENNNEERPISSIYNSPGPSQYSSYNSGESVKLVLSSGGVPNSYENFKYGESDYPSLYRTAGEQTTPNLQQFPTQKEPVSYSKLYDGSSHENYPSSETLLKPPMHNSYSSPQALPYESQFDDYTSLYSPKPRAPTKFKYYTAPKTANDYPIAYGSKEYSKPYGETPKLDLPKQSPSTYDKHSSESYKSPKDTFNIKDNPVSYVSYNDSIYDTRATPVSHTVPHSDIRTTYESGDSVSKDDPYIRTNKHSSNYESEPYARNHPTYELSSPYPSDVDTKLSYDKGRSHSLEIPHSPHKPYDYTSSVANSEYPPYVSENYGEKSVYPLHSKISKPASSYDSSYDRYGSHEYPAAYDVPSSIEGKNYNSSLNGRTTPHSAYQGSTETNKPTITRFYDTPSHSIEKTSRYTSKYPEAAPNNDLRKPSYYGSTKLSKYSVDEASSPVEASYHNSPLKSDQVVNKSPYYDSPHRHATSEMRDNHSARKNYKPSRPAPLHDEYEQPRHPPLPRNPNEEYSSYENVEKSPKTEYRKFNQEFSTHKPASYDSSSTDYQNGKYYPSSIETDKSHYSSFTSKEYDDEPKVYTKTKSVSKPRIISDDVSYYDDRSSESQYNKPNINDQPVRGYSNSYDPTHSYSLNPNSYSKPYSYSYPTRSSDEQHSYASEKNERSPTEDDTYSAEKEKRVEGVVYRSRKTYPGLPGPRSPISYLPYMSRAAPTFDSKVYERAPDKNLTKSPRKSSIKLKYKPVKKDSYQDTPVYDDSYEHTAFSNIPGEPGKDFPILKAMPYTHFSCENRAPGFYADTQHRCQVYYQCSAQGQMQSFLCPNGTIFNQETFVCEWWHNVDCAKSEKYFAKNNSLYKPNDRVDKRKSPPSGRSEEYPASDEYSDEDPKRHTRRYAESPRKRSQIVYNTPSR